MKESAAIFDLDGLMIETEKPMIPLLKSAAKSLGYEVSETLILKTVGTDAKSTADVWHKEMGADFPFEKINKIAADAMFAEFEKTGLPLRPGLLVLLDFLKSKNIPMAVATSSDQSRAFWKLKTAKIDSYFTAVATGNEVKHGKPAPDIFLLAAERLGKAPNECIAFEDSPAGLSAIYAAGMRSVFVKDVVEPSPEVLSTVWKRLSSLAEAVELF
jgi:HAD superfamily hydrolase (TIGR01509 family)